MDKLPQYRQAIKTLIERHARFKPRDAEVERQRIFDTEHDHYQLVNVGWHHVERIHHCVIHLDIKNHQVWIQQNNTEVEVDNELIALGIAPEDIVIAFLSPSLRPA